MLQVSTLLVKEGLRDKWRRGMCHHEAFTMVGSFNPVSETHLSDQCYSICFRRESGQCAICFQPVIVDPIAIDGMQVIMKLQIELGN